MGLREIKGCDFQTLPLIGESMSSAFSNGIRTEPCHLPSPCPHNVCGVRVDGTYLLNCWQRPRMVLDERKAANQDFF